jgi:predicted RNase H-like nuclease
MPLSHNRITGRRTSDNAVSRAYGARKCGTHSPSATRPGRISDDLRNEFGQAGYPLQTDAISPPGLIEVYPHPALVELANAPERLRYKCSKVRGYWPTSTPSERRTFLLQERYDIVALLEEQITGVAKALPPPDTDARPFELKAYEDMLDATICAWVAMRALKKGAKPFGDNESAIWIPNADPVCSTK